MSFSCFMELYTRYPFISCHLRFDWLHFTSFAEAAQSWLKTVHFMWRKTVQFYWLKSVYFILPLTVFVIFAVLFVFMAVSSDFFLTKANLLNMLRQLSINGILAVGMTFVLITGGIDLSVGAVLTFS